MLRKRLEPLTFFYEGVFMVTFSEHKERSPFLITIGLCSSGPPYDNPI
jgi:hypothetical protein